jgi:hypothetical protein
MLLLLLLQPPTLPAPSTNADDERVNTSTAPAGAPGTRTNLQQREHLLVGQGPEHRHALPELQRVQLHCHLSKIAFAGRGLSSLPES